jgi:hypothetical protein
MGTHAAFTWLRDTLCQESALEAVIRKGHQPVPRLSKEPVIENGCLQCPSPFSSQRCFASAEPWPDTQTTWYGMQAACSLEARMHTGVVQSLARYSPAQMLAKNSQLGRPDEVSRKSEALNCDIKFLRRPQRRYQEVSVVLVYWEEGKDEGKSFNAQDEVSDILLLDTTALTLDRLIN